MDKVAKLPAHQRKELFQQTAAKMPWFSEAAIEKDFWVCWMLKQLFNSSIQDVIIFKGGTSLSKIFHLIQRFSEDIDLILNWKDNTVGDPMLPRSHTSQTAFNKKLDKWSVDFVRQIILPEVQKVSSGICQAQISQDNPEHIVITYPKSFEDQYLRPQILLEIGARAAWVPHDTYTIRPYAAEAYPRISILRKQSSRQLRRNGLSGKKSLFFTRKPIFQRLARFLNGIHGIIMIPL